jgi:predicted dehydrogenase
MTTEKYTVSGEELVKKVKELIHEGNIRRVRVIQGGRTILMLSN